MSISTQKIKYNDLVSELLKLLNDREKEVLTKRYSLGGNDKATLEQIGQGYNITRERVRQIENEGLKKVRQADFDRIRQLTELSEAIAKELEQYGGFISQSHLMDNLLNTDESVEVKALKFVLDHVLSPKFTVVEIDDLDTVWRQDHLSDEQIKAMVDEISALVEIKGAPMSFEEIMNECQTCSVYSQIDSMSAENHKIIEAILRARQDMKKNILSQWGKESWTTVTPKRMTDKAYLVMLREQRPLHFEECADLINQSNFDKKKACAATVHNELILDDKYVLVGRGTYALKEWGYEAGTVSDIIEKILKTKGALDKKALSEEVLKQRLVQKTTITLSLMNKDRFAKNTDGTYSLVK